MELKFEAHRLLKTRTLQKAVPSITAGRKKPYIDYLHNNDKKKLELLVELEKARKKTSFYVFRLLSSYKQISSYDQLTNARYDKDDFIYKVTKLIRSGNSVVFKIRGYTNPRKISWCDQVNLKKQSVNGRKDFQLYMILHFDDSTLEVRTGSLDKANEAADIFSSKLVPSSKSILITDLKNKLSVKDTGTKPGYAEFEFAGSTVSLEGDPHQTIQAFKDNGFKLEDLGIAVEFDESTSGSLPVTCFSDGRIVATKNVEDPYQLIRDLIKNG